MVINFVLIISVIILQIFSALILSFVFLHLHFHNFVKVLNIFAQEKILYLSVKNTLLL